MEATVHGNKHTLNFERWYGLAWQQAFHIPALGEEAVSQVLRGHA